MSDGIQLTDEAYGDEQDMGRTRVASPERVKDNPLIPNDRANFNGELRHKPEKLQERSLPAKIAAQISLSQGETVDYDRTPPLGSPTETAKDKEVRYNTRTPNLDKIAKFFKNRPSASKENLLKKFEASHLEDTPESQRKWNPPRYPINARKVSSTELISNAEAMIEPPFFEANDSEERFSVTGPFNEEPNMKPCKADASKQDNTETIAQPLVKGIDCTVFDGNDHVISNASPLNERYEVSQKEKHPVIHLERGCERQVSGDSKSAGPTERRLYHQRELLNYSSDRESVRDSGREETGRKELTDSQRIFSQTHTTGAQPEYLSYSERLLDDPNDSKCHDQSVNSTRVDDTTADLIPSPWILHPIEGGIFNSNKSTQIVNTGGTQHISSQSAVSLDTSGMNKRFDLEPLKYGEETQIIASYISQAMPSPNANGSTQRENELMCSTQIIKSQDNATPHDLNTPPNLTRIIFEPIMEVPETSSPTKSKDDKMINFSPSSAPDALNNESYNVNDNLDNQDKVHLKILSKIENLSDQERNSTTPPDDKRNFDVVISETEYTQDLPEVEEVEGTQEIEVSNFDSWDALSTTGTEDASTDSLLKRPHGESLRPTFNNEHNRSLSRKKVRKIANSGGKTSRQLSDHFLKDFSYSNNQNGSDMEVSNHRSIHDQETVMTFPKEVLREEKDFLSKSDIKFEDAVWCQYSLDYNYYPGRIVSSDVNSDKSWVYFDTGTSLTKNDDIYYLDIRIGDVVDIKSRKYIVIGLECISHEPGTIRCIRGFDTVHLKKKNNSGKLAKKIIVRRLAEVTIDLKEWTKRPKVILQQGSQARTMAHGDLQHPIRGRKNTLKLSPRKFKSNVCSDDHPIYKEESDADDTQDVELTSALKPNGKTKSSLFSQSCRDQIEGRIFEGCLFVFTGFSEEREELTEVVTSLGGEVLDGGFSSIFKIGSPVQDAASKQLKYDLQIHLENSMKYSQYKFACLLTTQHSRSLKYLETLALRWPTLHWKFVRHCIGRNTLALDAIHQYLLPSGESYRLSISSSRGGGVIKSSDIFHFHENLILGKRLNEQIRGLQTVMQKFIVVVYGRSELDSFVKFAFCCLGVSTLYQVSEQGNALEISDHFTRRFDHIARKTNENSQILIYMNDNGGKSNSFLNDLRRKLSISVGYLRNDISTIHVETKEWLIQTIINENTGYFN